MNSIEQQLDHFDPAVRRRALEQLAAAETFPPPTDWHNLHSHTFFSYNAYGYSPSRFAYLAKKRGLGLAGIVDFDVLDGVDEFHAAGKLLRLKTVASIESRTFVPEFATRVINSPGEPGICYHMGVGFARAVTHPLLTQMRRTAEQRNRDLIARVNTFTAPVTLDYDRDVLPLTPNGKIDRKALPRPETESHTTTSARPTPKRATRHSGSPSSTIAPPMPANSKLSSGRKR